MSAGLLIVTAVPAEAEAIRAGLTSSTPTVAPVGVGPAAAAAGTARLLALAEADGHPYQAVISAGIAGGFPDRVALGTIVLGTRSIAADLGAESPDGFLPLDELGFGPSTSSADPALLDRLREALPRATVGAVITCSTVTGTAESALALAARYPDAVAEAMEGYGVAVAAGQAGVPFAELRTISNPVGPRDRGAWRINEAFEALRSAAAALG
ncbi:futalosine hydrolase [Micromonospora sp. NPDC050397]|uniref:futalosine hydrolase n=1 Tax=Micromonospora sp. NPDC050397 TaxID=3364279 RepID=UPI00384D5190